MSWIKIDDRFDDHPKFLDLSDAAFRAWVRGLAHCNRHMTDGALTPGAVRVATGGRPELAEELACAGLWDDAGGGAYQVHDFLEHNTPREDRLKAAADAKQRKARFNAKRAAEREAAALPPVPANDVAPAPTGTRSEQRPERPPKPSQAEAKDQIDRTSPASAVDGTVERVEGVIAGLVVSEKERRRLAEELVRVCPDGVDVVDAVGEIIGRAGRIETPSRYLAAALKRETPASAGRSKHRPEDDTEAAEQRRLGKPPREPERPKVAVVPWDELPAWQRRGDTREAYESRCGAEAA